MPAPNYTFYLNCLSVHSKMSNGNYVDKDWVVFFVTWNGSTYVAPACAASVGATAPQQPATNPFAVDGYIGLVESGNFLLLCNEPDRAALDVPIINTVPPATDLQNGWVIGPLQIDDVDEVSVTYFVTNLSYLADDQMAQTALKIGGTVVSVVGAALSPVTAGISGIIGGVINVAMQIIALVIGPHQKDCNGPVLASPPLAFNGAQLENLVATPLPGQQNVTTFMKTFVNAGLTQAPPGGCSAPITDVTWTIERDISPLQAFGETPPGKPDQWRPVAAASGTGDWAGSWGDGLFAEQSRIVCIVEASGSGMTGDTEEERLYSYLAGVLDIFERAPSAAVLFGQDPRTTRPAGAFAIAAVPAAPREISRGGAAGAATTLVMPISARYRAIVTERLGAVDGEIAENLTVPNLVEIPMTASSFVADFYPPPSPIQKPLGGTITPSSGGATLPVARAEIVTGGNTATEGGNTGGENIANVRGTAPNIVKISYAATLVVSATVSLQLYERFDPNGTLLGHSLRYLRVAADGTVVTDVMLAQLQPQPT